MQSEHYIPRKDGASLWTVASGLGPPCVLCHGGPGYWDNLGPVADMLDDALTVYRWDQRGAGRSSPEGPFSVATFVEDLDTIRERFGHERWIVGGHSWGASLAFCYALRYPQRVVSLLYLSGTMIARCRTLTIPVLVLHGAGDPRPLPALETLIGVLPNARLEVIPDAGHEPWLENPEAMRKTLRDFLGLQ